MDEDSCPETISRIFNIFFKTCTPPMKMTNFVTLPWETQRIKFQNKKYKRYRTLRSTNPAQVALDPVNTKTSNLGNPIFKSTYIHTKSYPKLNLNLKNQISRQNLPPDQRKRAQLQTGANGSWLKIWRSDGRTDRIKKSQLCPNDGFGKKKWTSV